MSQIVRDLLDAGCAIEDIERQLSMDL